MSILEGGLLALLEREFGPVNIAGSVALDLMAWPDIDLYVQLEADGAPKMQCLVPKVDEQLQRQGYLLARTIVYNEHLLPDPKFSAPYGLYDGFVFLHGESRRQWKLDFWGWTAAGYAEREAHHTELAHRLQNADRDLILRLKRAEEYGKEFTSVDVYEFAIAKAGSSVEELKDFVREREMPSRKP